MAMKEVVPLLTKIKRLNGLIGTKDITEWEDGFLKNVVPQALARANHGQVVTFSDKQLEIIDRIFEKHFSA